jgi:hypothetical protein
LSQNLPPDGNAISNSAENKFSLLTAYIFRGIPI